MEMYGQVKGRRHGGVQRVLEPVAPVEQIGPQRRASNKPVRVLVDGETVCGSMREAARLVDCDFSRLQKALNRGWKVKGHTVERVHGPEPDVEGVQARERRPERPRGKNENERRP